MNFGMPDEGYHTVVLGTTGSGKSTLASFLVSRSPFHRRPSFVIDYKYEDIFARLRRIREIGLYEPLPEHPGLYIVRPRPDESEGVERWLEKLWHHGNAGLYIDESYLMPDKAWLRNVMAQGRSLGITVIAATQRPVDVSRSLFTEASYVSVFRLNDDKDIQRVREFTPKGMMDRRLPDFHSFWYSPKHHRAIDPFPYAILAPVPSADVIVETIDERLRPRHKMI
jgi:hypothetical protein